MHVVHYVGQCLAILMLIKLEIVTFTALAPSYVLQHNFKFPLCSSFLGYPIFT